MVKKGRRKVVKGWKGTVVRHGRKSKVAGKVPLLGAVLFVLLLFLGSFILMGGAGAAKPKLVIWCHTVHQQVAEGTRGGAEINLAAEFMEKYNVELEWVTIPWAQAQGKVLRELSLAESTVNVAYIVDEWPTSTLLNMLEPLNPFMEANPIEDFDDLAEGMVSTFSSDGLLYVVPVRSNPQILHYNKAIFADRGITRAPLTFEELVEDARKSTYTRADGARVYGLGLKPREDIIAVVRAFGGEVLTSDYKVLSNQPPAVEAITILRDLYAEGVIPPNFTVLASKDYQSLIGEGLVVMTFFGDNYYLRFNDPAKSKVAGDMWFSWIPPSEKTGLDVASCKIGFWGMAIPKNSPLEKRDLAWNFIKYFAGKDTQLKMGLNGNGPVRVSTFDDPTYSEGIPYAAVSKKILSIARPHLPIFEGTAEVRDIFTEQASLVILGLKDPQQAMDAAAAAITAVLEREGISK